MVALGNTCFLFLSASLRCRTLLSGQHERTAVPRCVLCSSVQARPVYFAALCGADWLLLLFCACGYMDTLVAIGAYLATSLRGVRRRSRFKTQTRKGEKNDPRISPENRFAAGNEELRVV